MPIEISFDALGFFITATSFIFLALLGVRGYIRRELPTHLQISMHLCRKNGDDYQLKIPMMARIVLPSLYDFIAAMWIMTRARKWARQGEFAPIVSVPHHKSRWKPYSDQIMEPIKRFLSELGTQAWIDRAKDDLYGTNYQNPEEPFVIALVCEQDLHSLRAIVVPVDLLQAVFGNPATKVDFHPYYSRAGSRVETLRVLARAYEAWKEKRATAIGLCIDIVEL